MRAEAGARGLFAFTAHVLNVSRLRLRDYKGLYPMHCHNVVHEDHAMMVMWKIA